MKVKDKGNIEELFKSKFENFEPKVDAGLWSNIASAVNTTSLIGKTGISWIAKGLIFGVAATGIGIATFIYTGQEKEITADTNKNSLVKIEEAPIANRIPEADIIQIESKNDPVVEAHKAHIENELNKNRDSFAVDARNTSPNKLKSHKPSNKNKVTPINIDQGATIVVKNQTTPTIGEPSIRPVETNSEAVVDKVDQKIVYDKLHIQANQNNYLTVDCGVEAKNADSVVWNFNDGTVKSNRNPSHTYLYEGLYNVVVNIYKNGKSIQIEREVLIEAVSAIEEIPNVITPNNDGANDEFLIHSSNLASFYIVIQTKKGEKLFESNDPNFKWDGYSLNGEKMKEGIYFYQINAVGTEGKQYKIPGQLYIK